jgi:hypothetical protein
LLPKLAQLPLLLILPRVLDLAEWVDKMPPMASDVNLWKSLEVS